MHICAANLSDLIASAGFVLGAVDDAAPAWWAVGISILAAAISAFGTFRPSPPLHRQFAGRDELAKVMAELKEVREALEAIRIQETQHYDKIMEAGATRASNMYRKMDGVSATVSELGQRVAKIEGQISRGDHGTD